MKRRRRKPAAVGFPRTVPWLLGLILFIFSRWTTRPSPTFSTRLPICSRSTGRIPSASAPTATPRRPSRTTPSRSRTLIADPKQVLAIPGIGKEHAHAICRNFSTTANSRVQTELLEKYHPSMLQLLKIQGLGPKTIALIWSAYKVSDVDGVEKLARAGKIRELPRMGEKHEAKLLKAIEDYRRIGGRFLIDAAETEAEQAHRISRKTTPASTRSRPPDRCAAAAKPSAISTSSSPARPAAAKKHARRPSPTSPNIPPLMDVIASGDNKISFHLRSGMQVDVRLLPPESFGAAMQYFTGSKAHNVALRQRALKMGYTLNEYSLATLEGEKPVAGKTEEEIYAKLKLDYIPPEMRENLGEIDARRETRPAATDHAGRPAGRRAHAHRRNRRPQHHRRDGRGRQGARLQIHGHHRPLEEPGVRQRPRRQARRRAHRAHSRRRTSRSMASPSLPASKSTSWPTAISISPTTCSRRWTSSSPACTRSSIRNPRR